MKRAAPADLPYDPVTAAKKAVRSCDVIPRVLMADGFRLAHPKGACLRCVLSVVEEAYKAGYRKGLEAGTERLRLRLGKGQRLPWEP